MHAEKHPTLQRAPLAALFFVQILFGINYINSKIIIGSIPPMIWAALRACTAGLALFGIGSLLHRKKPTLNLKYFKHILLFACFGVIINQGSFLVGLHYTTATNSSILNTLIPVFTLLLVTLSGKEKATGIRILGFITAFIGVLVLRHIEEFSLSNQTWIGDLLTILNCLSYALFLTLSKKFMSSNDPLWVTAWMFLIGGLGLGILSIPSWSAFQTPTLTPTFIGCIAYSILGGTLLAYLLNNWVLVRVRASSVALFIYFQPVFTCLLAWFLFGETPSLRTILSSGLIFLGMLLSL